MRVLEPSPPTNLEPAFFADDPPNAPAEPPGLPIVSPVPNGDVTWNELAAGDVELSAWCADRWLGVWRRLAAPPDDFVATREALHLVAEHLLSAARFAAPGGKVGLRFTRGGFGTPFYGDDEQLRIEGTELVAVRGGSVQRVPLTTIGEMAAAVGVQPGAPTEVYEPSGPLAVDAPIGAHPEAVAFLGDWYGFCASALEHLRFEWLVSDSRTQLWPEHFDLAFEAGDAGLGRRASFGGSPGDAGHDDPYLYVSPWSAVPDDAYWNDTAFRGASLPLADLVAADDQRAVALAFFEAGRALLDR